MFDLKKDASSPPPPSPYARRWATVSVATAVASLVLLLTNFWIAAAVALVVSMVTSALAMHFLMRTTPYIDQLSEQALQQAEATRTGLSKSTQALDVLGEDGAQLLQQFKTINQRLKDFYHLLTESFKPTDPNGNRYRQTAELAHRALLENIEDATALLQTAAGAQTAAGDSALDPSRERQLRKAEELMRLNDRALLELDRASLALVNARTQDPPRLTPEIEEAFRDLEKFTDLVKRHSV